jgi:DmsE family decaheme c-type cytochrome
VKPWLRTAGTVLTALVAVCAFGGAALSGDPPTSSGTTLSPTAAPTPGWSGEAACVECHAEQRAALRGSSHAGGASCEDCHGPGAAHAADPGAAPMLDLGEAPFETVNDACAACHLLPFEAGVARHQHADQGMRCSDCHAVHASTARPLLRTAPTSLCLSCHEAVAPELRQASHHPVLEGRMRCGSCHVAASSGMAELAGAAPAGSSSICVGCHAEHDALAPFEHPVQNDAALAGEGCTVCHAPHGSAHARLLQRPGDALCLDCHSVPRHSTAHSGAFAGRRCLECHVDVHGSFTSRRFFRPELLGQDCLVCHEQ